MPNHGHRRRRPTPPVQSGSSELTVQFVDALESLRIAEDDMRVRPPLPA
jgi:hypothetical protein